MLRKVPRVTLDRNRFGALVRERRQQLNLSMVELRDAGGPVPATTSKIERGLEPNPARSTFERLDRALQWVPGSASRAWHGGNPSPIESVTPAEGLISRPHAQRPSDTIVVSHQLLPALSKVATRLRTARRAHDLPDDVVSSLDELDAIVDRLNRSWLIGYIEQRLIEAGSIAGDPLLTIILEHQLDDESRIGLADINDREEAAYLRWLLGRAHDLTGEQQQRFRDRWKLRQEGSR